MTSCIDLLFNFMKVIREGHGSAFGKQPGNPFVYLEPAEFISELHASGSGTRRQASSTILGLADKSC